METPLGGEMSSRGVDSKTNSGWAQNAGNEKLKATERGEKDKDVNA